MGKPTKFVPVYFAPDMDPSWMVNPGVLVDVQNMIPTTRGFGRSSESDAA